MAPYPVHDCARCRRATGWVDAAGVCADCLRADRQHHAYTDAHADWVPMAAVRLPKAEPPPSLAARAAAAVGARGRLERELGAIWARHVEPGETGPPTPTDGYELEVAGKSEEPAPDGSGVLVRFEARRHRFAGDHWEPLLASRLGPGSPRVFPASLEMATLAEAWSDFRAEVDAFNRAAWTEASDAQEEARRAAAERAERLRRETGTSELLGG